MRRFPKPRFKPGQIVYYKSDSGNLFICQIEIGSFDEGWKYHVLELMGWFREDDLIDERGAKILYLE